MFAIVALVLAVIGIYGVMSFAANRRAKEVAIRTALGATPADTLGLMLGHGLRLIVAGLLVGGLASVALTRALSRQAARTISDGHIGIAEAEV